MSPDSTAITAPSLADTSIYVKEHMISDVNENADPYQDLQIIKRLTKGKFPVYLTSSKFKDETYAMKVFKDADKCYENEIRFASLSHPNILSIVHNEKERTLVQKGLFMRLTYVLSEYAPHGNFFDFTTKHKNEMDDKLIRTYFRQLIEGLEYLHGIGVAHLDLNPENLQIDANFNLKISNFHLAYVASDDSIINRGITYYHSPEFANSLCLNIELDQISAVDIYSAGILLFILKSGEVPHTENHMIRGVNLRDLMHENHPEFWSQHCKIQGKGKNFFDNNFKDLFYKMINPNPKQRLSIKAIKQSEWYNGPVYSSQELSIKMKKILGC